MVDLYAMKAGTQASYLDDALTDDRKHVAPAVMAANVQPTTQREESTLEGPAFDRAS